MKVVAQGQQGARLQRARLLACVRLEPTTQHRCQERGTSPLADAPCECVADGSDEATYDDEARVPVAGIVTTQMAGTPLEDLHEALEDLHV